MEALLFYQIGCFAALLVVGLRLYFSFFRHVRLPDRRLHPLSPIEHRPVNLHQLIRDSSEIEPMLLHSASSLAAKIKSRSITSEYLVRMFYDHVQRVNPLLNAAVGCRFQEALREALEADARILQAYRSPGGSSAISQALKQLPPFHGVPCSIKECIAVRGMKHTAGFLANADQTAESDASVVSRMRAAGFIPLTTTNVSELCMWLESSNTLYGCSNNPYDLNRTPGGSSGGEAAMISALGAPCGVGSDVGGSIRIPSFFCGIYGHKPSSGLVPNTGGLPTAKGRIQRFCQPGPMCRHFEDLEPMLRLLAGPDGADNECGLAPASLAAVQTNIDVSAALAGSTSIQRTKVYVLNCDASFRQGFANRLLMSPCDPRSIDAVRRAAESLRSHHVDVIELTLPEFGEAFEMWSTLMGQAQSQPFRGLLRRRGCGAPWELMKHAVAALFSACFGANYLNCSLSASVNTVPALGLSLVERFGEWSSHSHRHRMESLCCNTRDKLNALLGEDSVLLLPPHPVLTPVHNWAWYSLKFFNCAYTAVFNALELPVTSVPLGLTDDADRLPLGVQVVGSYGRDRATLNVARALDDKFGGWHAPR